MGGEVGRLMGGGGGLRPDRKKSPGYFRSP